MKFEVILAVQIIILCVEIGLTEQQSQGVPNSPCPQLFQYRYDGNNWYGEMVLPSPPIQHNEVILLVTLSLRAATSQDNVGVITVIGSNQEVTNKIVSRQPISFRVSFPYRFPIPKLVRIVYDNNLLCTGPEEPPNSETVVSRIELKHVMKTYTSYQPSGIDSSQFIIERPSNANNNLYSFEILGATVTTTGRPQYDNNVYVSQSSQPINPFGTNNNNYPMMVPPPQYVMPGIPQQQIPQQQIPQQQVPQQIPQQQYQRPSTSASVSQDVNSICGTRYSEGEVTPFVFGGEDTQRGDWPWMVAIYLNKATGLSFNCGGSLVSSKAVVTAAHCINTSTKNYRANEVVLYLGRYSLIDWSEQGSIATNVDQIIIHSDYKRQRESFDADIAILIMTKRIEFNAYVRPVCLWPASGIQNVQQLEGRKGTVVGWGKDGTDRVVSNIPKKVDLPIVNSITCVQTSESLSKAVSNRTFCAGTLNGDGPCHGDSGGGLTLYQNNRWMLRGIVSAGLSDANTGACKLMDYVVFTDVSLFSSWIRSIASL